MDDLSWFLAPLINSGPTSTRNIWKIISTLESSCSDDERPNVWSAPPSTNEMRVYKTPLGTELSLCRLRHEAVVHGVTNDEAGLFRMLDGLDVLLGFSGLLPLHCAAFKDEELGYVLVVGPSGAGKSSLSMAFLNSGATFLADDRLLYYFKGESLELFPFRGFRKVYENEKPEKTFLDMELVRAHIDEKYVKEGFTPDLLLFPKIVSPEKSSIGTIKSSWQLFQGLIAESYVPAAKECHEVQMQWLRRLSHLPAFEVHLGADDLGRDFGLTRLCKNGRSELTVGCEETNCGAC